jgi:5-carboxymethyl-2-hydroxymuconate isomerase
MIRFSNLFKKIQEKKHTSKEATKMLKEAFSDKQKQINTLNIGLQELKKLESTKENVTKARL